MKLKVTFLLTTLAVISCNGFPQRHSNDFVEQNNIPIQEASPTSSTEKKPQPSSTTPTSTLKSIQETKKDDINDNDNKAVTVNEIVDIPKETRKEKEKDNESQRKFTNNSTYSIDQLKKIMRTKSYVISPASASTSHLSNDGSKRLVYYIHEFPEVHYVGRETNKSKHVSSENGITISPTKPIIFENVEQNPDKFGHGGSSGGNIRRLGSTLPISHTKLVRFEDLRHKSSGLPKDITSTFESTLGSDKISISPTKPTTVFGNLKHNSGEFGHSATSTPGPDPSNEGIPISLTNLRIFRDVDQKPGEFGHGAIAYDISTFGPIPPISPTKQIEFGDLSQKLGEDSAISTLSLGLGTDEISTSSTKPSSSLNDVRDSGGFSPQYIGSSTTLPSSNGISILPTKPTEFETVDLKSSKFERDGLTRDRTSTLGSSPLISYTLPTEFEYFSQKPGSFEHSTISAFARASSTDGVLISPTKLPKFENESQKPEVIVHGDLTYSGTVTISGINEGTKMAGILPQFGHRRLNPQEPDGQIISADNYSTPSMFILSPISSTKPSEFGNENQNYSTFAQASFDKSSPTSSIFISNVNEISMLSTKPPEFENDYQNSDRFQQDGHSPEKLDQDINGTNILLPNLRYLGREDQNHSKIANSDGNVTSIVVPKKPGEFGDKAHRRMGTFSNNEIPYPLIKTSDIGIAGQHLTELGVISFDNLGKFGDGDQSTGRLKYDKSVCDNIHFSFIQDKLANGRPGIFSHNDQKSDLFKQIRLAYGNSGMYSHSGQNPSQFDQGEPAYGSFRILDHMGQNPGRFGQGGLKYGNLDMFDHGAQNPSKLGQNEPAYSGRRMLAKNPGEYGQRGLQYNSFGMFYHGGQSDQNSGEFYQNKPAYSGRNKLSDRIKYTGKLGQGGFEYDRPGMFGHDGRNFNVFKSENQNFDKLVQGGYKYSKPGDSEQGDHWYSWKRQDLNDYKVTSSDLDYSSKIEEVFYVPNNAKESSGNRVNGQNQGNNNKIKIRLRLIVRPISNK